MLRSFAVLTVMTCLVSSSFAAAKQFPYEADVTADDVEVRSGPGKSYYATSRLQRNDRVIVHRHDPGGWFMILPPPGSISWIDSAQVERNGSRGVVSVPADPAGLPGQAIVHIGSTLSEDHAFTGRQLANGDEVQILGEKVLQTEQGALSMLKIAPPPREYRWVKGDFIVPVDPSLRKEIDQDPYAIPSAHRNQEQLTLVAAQAVEAEIPEPMLQAESRTTVRAPKASEGSIASPAPAASAERLRLIEIDRHFSEMSDKDVLEWRLDEVRQAYMSLRAASPSLASQIDSRMESLDARQKIYDEFYKFVTLTSQTDLREAQLTGGQPDMGSQPGMVMQTSGETPAVELGHPAMETQNSVVPAGGLQLPELPSLSTANLPPQSLNGQMAVEPAAAEAATSTPKLDGAGIVQLVNSRTPGVPRHMLVAPDGRFLAFVECRDVNLDQYVGQSLGLIGQRGRDARLQADVIQVRQMLPVQLTR